MAPAGVQTYARDNGCLDESHSRGNGETWVDSEDISLVASVGLNNEWMWA